MAQAYDAIIATITVASDASQVVQAMVKSTEWREGTSGSWSTTDCTLNASTTYQFRTPLSGMSSTATAILPNIKASVTVDWDTTATPISTLGDSFMRYYAYNCTSLTSLDVPDTSGLTSVGIYFMGSYASGCSSLTSLSVPDTSGLTSVGNFFMYYYAGSCSSLTSLSVPDTSGLTSVGDFFMLSYANGCSNLASLSVPDTSGFTSVGSYFMGFYASGCSSLTSLPVPDTSVLTSVGTSFMRSYAYNCSNLASLSVPDTSGLTSVGDFFMRSYADGCSSLTSLSVPDTSGLTSVGNYFMYYYALYCSSLTSLSAPDTSGLTSVGDYFMYYYAYGCSNLTSLSVPDTSGITTVGISFMYNYAYGCSSLTSLILPDSTGWFGSHNVDWSIPSARLGYLNGIVSSPSAETAWEGLIDVGETLYTNYIRSVDNVILSGRYWVGGPGSWNDSSNWSTSSGGSGGASVPTSSHDVVIDANSGLGSGGTITFDGAYGSCVCHDITCTSGHTYLVDFVTSDFNIYGSAVFEAGFTANVGTWIYFSSDSTETITVNGGQLNYVEFDGTGNFTITDDLIVNYDIDATATNTLIFQGAVESDYFTTDGSFVTLGGNLNIRQYGYIGNFDANGYDVTAGLELNIMANSNGPGSSTVNMGSGTWTCDDFFFVQTTGYTLTVNPETSTVHAYHATAGYDAIIYTNIDLTLNNILVEADGLGVYAGNLTCNEIDLTHARCSFLNVDTGSTLTVNNLLINGGASGDEFVIDSDVIQVGSPARSSTTGQALYSGATTAAGHSLTGIGGNISFMDVNISKTGSPTGNLYAKVYEHSGTFGTSSVPTGTALATSDALDVSTLTTNPASKNITFSGANQIELVEGTNYVFTVEYSGGDSSNYVKVDYRSSYDPGNYVAYSGSTWTAYADRDFNHMYVYTLGAHTLSMANGIFFADYLDISNSIATGGASWYAGANSIDSGGNTGWTFTDPPGPIPYYWDGDRWRFISSLTVNTA